MQEKLKVLILYNKIWTYRERVFEILNEKYDLTVAYTDKVFQDKAYAFKTIFTPGKDVGPFFIHQGSLNKLCGRFDVVIGLNNTRWLSVMLPCLIPWRRYRMLLWGIGVSASYDNHFDQNKKWDFARYFFGRFADALIFYSDYPISKYLSRGFKQERLFVAHNTTAVSQDICLTAEKNSFLFVGTLYAEKGLAALLRAYQQAAMSEPDMPVLYIIGDGPEKGNIEKLIRELGLAGKVFLKGAIYDMEALKPYYETALACVSPNQAGLSVLTSMGHGVPFVTEKNAITGGEIFNLRHMATGFVYEGGAGALAKTFSWIVNNQRATNDIGRNARDFYVNNRTPEHMAAALADAIESAARQGQA